jgi:hypothetical protein
MPQVIADCLECIGHLVPNRDYEAMRVIALSTLRAFMDKSPSYADARQPVMAWYRQVRAADWALTFGDQAGHCHCEHTQRWARCVQHTW